MLLGFPEVFHHAPARFIAGAPGADLPLVDEHRQSGQRLFLLHAVIRPVGLVEVNVVRLQTAEAILAGLEDLTTIQGRETTADWRAKPAVARPSDLCGQNDLAASLPTQPAAHDLLGDAKFFGAGRHGIHLRRIEEVDPRLQSAVHDREGGLFIGLKAEGHGSHADVRDDDASAAEAIAFHKASRVACRCSGATEVTNHAQKYRDRMQSE